MVEIDRRAGEMAVSYARSVIDGYLTERRLPDPRSDNPTLSEDRGAFVTLEVDDRLRGCIGRPYPNQSGFEAIRSSAVGAATEDPRFPPVSTDELSTITVEVSVLGTPEAIDPGGIEVDRHVRVGRDGLLVKHAGRSGLLLPQVPVSNDWSATEFLAQTCRKAGLPAECWRETDVTVERFTADVFAEVTPEGRVDRVELGEAALV